MFTACIEIPQGDDRRRHKSWDTGELTDFGPIKEKIPVNEGVMPVHYGYILDTENTDEERPEEVDVIVISEVNCEIGQTIEIQPIGVLERADGDHKIVATTKDDSTRWDTIAPERQQLILDYFGYKSPIERVLGEEAALSLIEKYSKK